MKKKNMNRIFVTFVALLFIGSMGGAMLYSTGNNNEAPQLPQEHILTGLPDEQKQFIISSGYVLIEAKIPSACYLECAATKRGLEQAVAVFNPAVYLVESGSSSASVDVPVSMESFRGKKDLSAYNQTAVKDFVCENSAFRLDECVIRKIETSGFNGTNRTI